MVLKSLGKRLGRRIVAVQPAQCLHLSTFDLMRRCQAGTDGGAVQQHGASTAIPGIASDLYVARAQLLAENLGQAHPGRWKDLDPGTVQTKCRTLGINATVHVLLPYR